MSGKTKYQQVYRSILERIESGTLRASERLPSQPELADHFKVSVGTVQKALQQLEQDGLVATRHGSGTYVTFASPTGEQIVNFRFLDAMDRVLPLYTKVESVSESGADGPWRSHLGVDKCVVVKRIVNVDLQFSTISTVYLRFSEFGFLCKMPMHELDGHELTRIIERQRMPSRRFLNYISATILSDQCCLLNHLGQRERGMLWTIFGYTLDDRPNWYQVVEVPLTENRLELSGVVQRSGDDLGDRFELQRGRTVQATL